MFFKMFIPIWGRYQLFTNMFLCLKMGWNHHLGGLVDHVVWCFQMSEGNMVCEGWWPWILVQCKTWDDLRSSIVLHWTPRLKWVAFRLFGEEKYSSKNKGDPKRGKNRHVSNGYFHLIGRSHQDKTLRSTRRRGTAGWKRRRETNETKRDEKTGGMTRVLWRVPRWRGVVNSIQVVRHVDQAWFMMFWFKENIFDNWRINIPWDAL